MKPYGSKKKKKVRGDGCFLCTQEKKTTKSANRSKMKLEDRIKALSDFSTDVDVSVIMADKVASRNRK